MPGGNYVSPAGSPYQERALPPANQDYNGSDPGQQPYAYHVYEVREPVVVVAGPVAPWFGQPGFGTQFELPAKVGELEGNGTLVEVDVKEQCRRRAVARLMGPGGL